MPRAGPGLAPEKATDLLHLRHEGSGIEGDLPQSVPFLSRAHTRSRSGRSTYFSRTVPSGSRRWISRIPRIVPAGELRSRSCRARTRSEISKARSPAPRRA